LLRLGKRGTYWSYLSFFLFSSLLNRLFMLNEDRYEKLGMVVDCTLSLAFKGYVSNWEPIFFHFFVVATFFTVRYMIATLLFRCPRYTRRKNWKDVKSYLKEWNPRALWSSFLLFSTLNTFASWLRFIPITCVSHIMSPHSWDLWLLACTHPLTPNKLSFTFPLPLTLEWIVTYIAKTFDSYPNLMHHVGLDNPAKQCRWSCS
jgi:hypothetical protein